MNQKKNIFFKKIRGSIFNDEILKQIISIGFEFETGKIIPFMEENMILSPVEYEKYNIYTDNTNSVIFNLTQDMPYTNSKTLFTKFSNNITRKTNNGKICALIKSIREPPLLFNLNESSMGHTEFHFTYKKFNSHNNIIIEALKYSSYLLKIYLEDSKLSELALVILKEITLPLNIEEIINNKISLYKLDNNIVYILPNDGSKRDTIDTIHFYIHMTISIKLNDAINVLSYLLLNSIDFKYKHKKIFEDCVNKSYEIVNKFIIDNNINRYNQDIMFLVDKLYNWIALLLYFVIRYTETRNKTRLIFILRHTYSEIFPLKNTTLHNVWIIFLNENSSDIKNFITNVCYMFIFNSSKFDPYDGLTENNLLNLKNSQKFSYEDDIILIEYRGLNLDFKKITGRKKILLSDIDNL